MPSSPTSTHFNRYPVFWLAIAFAAGILASSAADVIVGITLPATVVLATAAIWLRKQSVAAYFIVGAFVAAGSASAAIEKHFLRDDRIRELYDGGTIGSGEPIEVEGVLLGRPEPSRDGAFLTLRTVKITSHGTARAASGTVRLFLPVTAVERAEDGPEFDISDLKYGSRLVIACSLMREDEFLNPGVITKREVLDSIGIDATASIKSPLLIEKTADESVFIPLAWVYDQRAQLITDFRQNLSASAAGVMIASLLGDKYFLDKDTADLFRDGGTFHILVISGLHITFIGGLLLLFVRQFTGNRWLQMVITVSFTWAYTLAVGADVPVVRAAIMFTILLFSYAINRQGSMLNSLGICTLVLLVTRPSDLFNSSFQLTLVSVGALVGAALPLVEMLRRIGSWMPTAPAPFPPDVPAWLRRLCETLYWNADAWRIEANRQIWKANLFKAPYFPTHVVGVVRTLLHYVFEGLLVSLVVSLWMLPLTVVYFHRVSAASVLLNLWVGFFIALESFAAVIGSLLSHFSSLFAAGFFGLAEGFNWLDLALPRLFSDNGWASFRLPAYSGAGRTVYIVYFLLLLVLTVALNRWRPFDVKCKVRQFKRPLLIASSAAVTVLAGIIVFHPFSASPPDGRLHFDFLDVGQGDSALVTFPDGETLLVDGGGRVGFGIATGGDDSDAAGFEPDVRGIGEAVVSEFLWDRGLSRVDHILATHADADHIQGLTDVAKNFSVDSALFGRMPMHDHDFAELDAVMRRRRIPAETVSHGDVLRFGDVTVEVLYPVPTDDPDAVSDNDHSVVLRIVYGERIFLMTGDIERAAEADILRSGESLWSDLIKVAHHGSHTSSTQPFIDAVGARVAVISVGRRSPFGHPHADVVDRWKASGVDLMTTGERGTISVSTDGEDLTINTFMP